MFKVNILSVNVIRLFSTVCTILLLCVCVTVMCFCSTGGYMFTELCVSVIS